MKFLLCLFSLLILCACVDVSYVDDIIPITQRHNVIAILPPTTTIERKIWMTDSTFKNLTQKEQASIQEDLERLLVRKLNNGTSFVEIQDLEQTNAILGSLNYPNSNMDPKELAKKLRVDAVFKTEVQLLEPYSEALVFLFRNSNALLPTNQQFMTASIHDSIHNGRLWSLSTEKTGYLGSIKNLMQHKLMKRTTLNIPYNIKKNPYKKLYKKFLYPTDDQ